MELQKCPACNKDISIKASSCIHCGHPLEKLSHKKKTAPWAWVFLGIFIALGIAYFTSSNFKENYRPKMPISLEHRAALLGDSRVVKITNLSTNLLRIIVTFERPSTGNIKTETFQLSANESESFGSLQGWGFKSGDKITIQNNTHRKWQGTIP